MSFRSSLFLLQDSLGYTGWIIGHQLILVGWLGSSGCRVSSTYRLLSVLQRCGTRIEWMLTVCAKLLHWLIMADLGQVTPFNASVPHLSNGVIILTYLTGVLWGIVNHSWQNPLGSSMEDALSWSLGFVLTELSQGWNYLVTSASSLAPPLIKAASSDVDSVFHECWSLNSPDLLRMLRRNGTQYFLSCIHKRGCFETESIGLRSQGCYCLFPCRLGVKVWNLRELSQEQSTHHGAIRPAHSLNWSQDSWVTSLLLGICPWASASP